MQALKKSPPPPDLSAGVARSEWISHLREVSLFVDIREDPGALEALADRMQFREFAPGTNILTEGQTGSEMFLLVGGQASVHKSTSEGEDYKVAILQGAFHVCFGEGGLLDSDSRSATIKADTVCTCLVLDRPAFESFSKQYPQWALPVLMRIARAVMARLRKTNDDLSLLYNALVAEIRGH